MNCGLGWIPKGSHGGHGPRLAGITAGMAEGSPVSGAKGGDESPAYRLRMLCSVSLYVRLG